MRLYITRLVLLMGLLVLLAACGANPSATAPAQHTAEATPLAPGSVPTAEPSGGMDHHGMPSTETTAPAAMDGMDHGATAATTDAPYDAQFIDSMIVHHQGAIAMARDILAQPAVRPELTAMAEGIITAQEAEIAQLEQWRRDWYPDLPPTAGMGMDPGDMHLSEDTSIPVEQRFITAMIAHHQGAIAMARDAQTRADHAELTTLAQDIITAQEAETAQLEQWLQEWFQ